MLCARQQRKIFVCTTVLGRCVLCACPIRKEKKERYGVNTAILEVLCILRLDDVAQLQQSTGDGIHYTPEIFEFMLQPLVNGTSNALYGSTKTTIWSFFFNLLLLLIFKLTSGMCKETVFSLDAFTFCFSQNKTSHSSIAKSQEAEGRASRPTARGANLKAALNYYRNKSEIWRQLVSTRNSSHNCRNVNVNRTLHYFCQSHK